MPAQRWWVSIGAKTGVGHLNLRTFHWPHGLLGMSVIESFVVVFVRATRAQEVRLAAPTMTK